MGIDFGNVLAGFVPTAVSIENKQKEFDQQQQKINIEKQRAAREQADWDRSQENLAELKKLSADKAAEKAASASAQATQEKQVPTATENILNKYPESDRESVRSQLNLTPEQAALSNAGQAMADSRNNPSSPFAAVPDAKIRSGFGLDTKSAPDIEYRHALKLADFYDSKGLADQAQKQRLEAKQAAAGSGMSAYLRGDTKMLTSMANTHPDGVTYTNSIIHKDDKGKSLGVTFIDSNGNKSFSDHDTTMNGFLSEMNPVEAAKLNVQDSKIQAGMDNLNKRLDQQEQLALFKAAVGNAGGSGSHNSGSSGSSGGKGSGRLDLKGWETLLGKNPETGAVSPLAQPAMSAYHMILDQNPQLDASESGKQQAQQLATNVAKGEAKIVPEMQPDGSFSASIKDGNGNSYSLGRNIDPAPYIKKDEKGNEVGSLKSSDIDTAKTNYLNGIAKSDPAGFDEFKKKALDDNEYLKLRSIGQSPNATPQQVTALRIAVMIRGQSGAAAPGSAGLANKITKPSGYGNIKGNGFGLVAQPNGTQSIRWPKPSSAFHEEAPAADALTVGY